MKSRVKGSEQVTHCSFFKIKNIYVFVFRAITSERIGENPKNQGAVPEAMGEEQKALS